MVQEGCIAAVTMAPPCNTWSHSRHQGREKHFGPRRLRRPNAHEVYGLKDLDYEERKQVAQGMLLVIRSWNMADTCLEDHVPWVLEYPEPWAGETNITTLREAKGAVSNSSIFSYSFDQGCYGATSREPTSLIGSRSQLHRIVGRCSHKPVWW